MEVTPAMRALGLIAVVVAGGCAVTTRVAPAVTVDNTGKLGAQVLIGVGLAFYDDGARRSFEMGLAGGPASGKGDRQHAVVIEDDVEYAWLPPEHAGASVFLGAHVGLRPTTFAVEGDETLISFGMSARAAYRVVQVRHDGGSLSFGDRLSHFFGAEARCDVEGAAGDGGSPVPVVCAVGPHYELVMPFAEASGRLF